MENLWLLFIAKNSKTAHCTKKVITNPRITLQTNQEKYHCNTASF